MSFITRLDYTADLFRVKKDLDHCLSLINGWPAEDFTKKIAGNQISVSNRPGATDVWLDAIGSLYNSVTGEFVAKEKDFSEYNPYIPDYTKSTLNGLKHYLGINFGRIRFMRLMPKTGLTIHADLEQRYHLALDTNPYALFGRYNDSSENQTVAECFHIPADGYFYKVDTREKHFVFNGGWEPRIHLVICEVLNN